MSGFNKFVKKVLPRVGALVLACCCGLLLYLFNYFVSYTTLFSKYGEDKYQARFPDLDDMATGGEDFNEAYRMAMDL